MGGTRGVGKDLSGPLKGESGNEAARRGATQHVTTGRRIPTDLEGDEGIPTGRTGPEGRR